MAYYVDGTYRVKSIPDEVVSPVLVEKAPEPSVQKPAVTADIDIRTWSENGIHAGDAKKLKKALEEGLVQSFVDDPVSAARVLVGRVRTHQERTEELLEERKGLFAKIETLDSQITTLEHEMKDLRHFKVKMNGPKCTKHDLPYILSSGVGKPCCPDCVRETGIDKDLPAPTQISAFTMARYMAYFGIANAAIYAEHTQGLVSKGIALALQYLGL